MSDFQAFPKMARLSREIVVTEKIDGTSRRYSSGPNCRTCASTTCASPS